MVWQSYGGLLARRSSLDPANGGNGTEGHSRDGTRNGKCGTAREIAAELVEGRSRCSVSRWCDRDDAVLFSCELVVAPGS